MAHFYRELDDETQANKEVDTMSEERDPMNYMSGKNAAIDRLVAERDEARREAAKASRLRRFIDRHMHQDECDCDYCIDARDILART